MRKLKPFTYLLFGFLLGVGAATQSSSSTTGAHNTPVQPKIVGSTGYLMGWEVKSSSGDTVCDDPYIWTATREIECD